jgi:hypothetical protein
VYIPGENEAARHGSVTATWLGSLQVSPSVLVTVLSLDEEVSEDSRTVRIFQAQTWGQPPRLSVFTELLVAAKEAVRQFGSAVSIVFVHDDAKREGGLPGASLALAWIGLQSAL